MKWCKDPYISEKVRKTHPDLARELEEGKYSSKVWLIMLSPNGQDLLDVRRASGLGVHGLEGIVPLLAGAAASKGEALTLVETIVQDCLNKTGGVDLRSFLSRE